MFLSAPPEIVSALSKYLKSSRKIVPPLIKQYIDVSLKNNSYFETADKLSLDVIGSVYNLEAIYQRLNQEYFQSQVDLDITWYGKCQFKNRRQITFGLYSEALKLIKINRILDQDFFPSFFVDYVVFHEMLHSVCPVTMGNKGKREIHSQDFKLNEKKFKFFDEATRWMKQNRESFFIP